MNESVGRDRRGWGRRRDSKKEDDSGALGGLTRELVMASNSRLPLPQKNS